MPTTAKTQARIQTIQANNQTAEIQTIRIDNKTYKAQIVSEDNQDYCVLRHRGGFNFAEMLALAAEAKKCGMEMVSLSEANDVRHKDKLSYTAGPIPALSNALDFGEAGYILGSEEKGYVHNPKSNVSKPAAIYRNRDAGYFSVGNCDPGTRVQVAIFKLAVQLPELISTQTFRVNHKMYDLLRFEGEGPSFTQTMAIAAITPGRKLLTLNGTKRIWANDKSYWTFADVLQSGDYADVRDPKSEKESSHAYIISRGFMWGTSGKGAVYESSRIGEHSPQDFVTKVVLLQHAEGKAATLKAKLKSLVRTDKPAAQHPERRTRRTAAL